MAMMNKMRQYTKSVLWVVIVAFIGTIVFAWGMGGFSDSDDPVRRGIMGVVDGVEISSRYFQSLYEEEYSKAIEESPDGEVSEQRAKELRDIVWIKILNEIIIDKQKEKLGVTISDKELVEFMQRYPLPEMQANPGFQTDGKFDYSKYMAALQDPGINWLPVENYARNQLSTIKVQRLIMTPFYVTDDDVRRAYEDDFITLDIEYIRFGLEGSPDLDRPTDEEIREYFEEHIEEFKMPQYMEKAVLSLAKFDPYIRPEVEDSILAKLNSIYERLMAGESFEELANEYSEDETSGNGGDLPWTKEGGFVLEYDDAISVLNPGEITKPFRTEYGYHIAKLEDVRDEKLEKGGTVKSYKTRHIMLNANVDPDEAAAYEAGIEGLKDVKSVEEFEKKAKELGGSVTVTERLGGKSTIPELGVLSHRLIQFALGSEPGAVGKVHRHGAGFVVACVKETLTTNKPEIEDVRDIITFKIETGKALDEREPDILKFLEDLKNPGDFKRLAKKRGLRFKEKKGVTRNELLGKTFAREPRFAAAPFKLTKDNPISKPLRGERAYYLMRLVNRKEFDEDQFAAKRDSIYRAIATGKQNKLYQGWYSKTYNETKIEDYRSSYFQGD